MKENKNRLIERDDFKLFTIREVAERLGLSVRTVWTLVKSQAIGHVRPTARTVRISQKQIIDFIRRNRIDALEEL